MTFDNDCPDLHTKKRKNREYGDHENIDFTVQICVLIKTVTGWMEY